MDKRNIIKKNVKYYIRGGGILLGVILLAVLVQILQKEYIKHSIQIVDVPPELLSEGLVEWEESGAALEADTTAYLLGKQCFCYFGRTKNIYYIPTVTFHYTDITEGIPTWACCVYVRRVTMKDGNIVKNSRLEWNQMKLEIELNDEGGLEFDHAYGQMVGEEENPLVFYESDTHQVRYEIAYPLAKADPEGSHPYIAISEHFLNSKYIREKPYQGTLEIVCSIGKQRIEGEFLFAYRVKGNKDSQ